MQRNGKDFLKEQDADIFRMIRAMMGNYILAKFRNLNASSPLNLAVADSDTTQILRELLK